MKDEISLEELTLARSRFIEDVYPRLFGNEEMGDPAAEFTTDELTAVLVAYEGRLASEGLLKVINPE
jgi:hypothetical protein